MDQTSVRVRSSTKLIKWNRASRAGQKTRSPENCAAPLVTFAVTASVVNVEAQKGAQGEVPGVFASAFSNHAPRHHPWNNENADNHPTL